MFCEVESVPATFMLSFLMYSPFFYILVVVSWPVFDISVTSSSRRPMTTFSGLKSVWIILHWRCM